MRKFLTVAIPLVTIAIFICIMLSGSILKKPLKNNDDFEAILSSLIENVLNGTWDEAGPELEDLENAWDLIKPRIQFSSERDEINYISVNLARLKGAVLSEDMVNALMEAYEVYDHWNTLVE